MTLTAETTTEQRKRFSLPKFPDSNLLTHSAETKWNCCKRKYFLADVLGIRPVHRSDPLRIGGGIHKGLEAFKNGGDELGCEAAVRADYAESECPPWLTPDEFSVEVETSAAIIRAYWRRWHDDKILKYLAVELPFELPIINPATGRETPCFRSAGKIDAIVELPDGRIAIEEHKTTSDALDIDGDYWKRLALDSQISRYVLAARDKGFHVETTIYDVIRKPAIRLKNVTKADQTQANATHLYFELPLDGTCPERETAQMYGARLLADMQERPSFYFARCEVPRLDADLEEFRSEQWTTQRHIREAEKYFEVVGAASFPRNTSACTFPFRCEYLDICRGMKGDPTEKIPDGFRRVQRLHEELPIASEGET